MNLIDKLRLMQVKRYAICHVNRDQSVAEHSYNVMLIAVELAQETRDFDVIQEVTSYAMVHDMEEIYTGDIPSGFKKRLRAECPAVTELLNGIYTAPDSIKAIVKLADYLEAMYYLREFGGSRIADQVLEDITRNFHEECQTSKANPRVVARAQAIWVSLE